MIHISYVRLSALLQATLVRDANGRWLLPGDGGGETPRLQLARTFSLMAVACPTRGGGSGRAGVLTPKDVLRMLVNSMRCVWQPVCTT